MEMEKYLNKENSIEHFSRWSGKLILAMSRLDVKWVRLDRSKRKLSWNLHKKLAVVNYDNKKQFCKGEG